MKNIWILIALAIAIMTTTGCVLPIPGREVVASSISGTVIDGVTRKPVQGATVKWKDLTDPGVETDVNGQFVLPGEADFHLARIVLAGGYVSIPQERAHQTYAKVLHPDYRPATIHTNDFCDDPGVWPRDPIEGITVEIDRK